MRRVKRSLCLVFALVFALMSVLPAGMLTVSADDIKLAGWGGDYSFENGVLTVNNTGNGNNYVASDKQSSAFTLEATMKYLNGGTADAGILFGAPAHTMESAAGGWYGAGVNGGNARVFCERGADELNTSLAIPESTEPLDPTNLKVKLVVGTDKSILFYVNDMETPVVSTSAPNFKGGYVGFVSYNQDVEFSNIKFTDNSPLPVEGNFKTNIEGDWTSAGGSWSITEDGVYGDNISAGDAFYISPKELSSEEGFVLEGDFHYNNGGGGGLVFGVKDPANPKSCWYCINVDRQSKIAKLFKNTGGEVWNANRPLTKEELEKSDYRLRVEMLPGGIFNYYLDKSYVGTYKDSSYEGGYLGMMTFGGNAVFQNITYTPVTAVPELIDLKLEGIDLNEKFSKDRTSYTAEVPSTVESVKVIASTTEAFTVQVNGKAVASGAASDAVTLESGYNDIVVRAVDPATEVASVVNIRIKKASDPTLAFQEAYRPQFHFTPEFNWMNDPNGLQYNASTKEYHMYYQYNPYGTAWGNMSWGHAVSKDLISWTEMPVTMTPDNLGAIFSGCGVIDRENTCGLFPESVPKDERMVAIFTHSGGDTTYGGEKQSLAYSTDNGRTWIKYDHNPVLSGAGITNGFRDPQVWWQEDSGYAAGGIWLMIVAGGDARLYSSPNLTEWTLESDLYYSDGTTRIHSECPGLFPLKVEGTNETKWVYNGAGRWCVVGDLVKEGGKYHFKALTGQIPYNGGGDMYATQKWYNDAKGRTLLTSWMQETAMDGKDWTGAQSLPLVTGLKKINGQYRMTAYAPEEINAYRSENPIYELHGQKVGEQDENILSGVAGQKYDIEATIDPGDATAFGFNLRKGGNNQLTVRYDVNGNRLYVDKSKTGGPGKNETFSYELYQTADGKIKLRIIVDWSVIDVFGNDGEAAINTIYYTALENAGLDFFTNGNVTIDSLKIWDMKSMYRDDITSPDGNPTMLLLSAPGSVDINEAFTVTANVLPSNATDKTVTWECDAGLTILSQTDTTLKARASAPGDYTIKAVTNTGGLEKEVTISVIEKKFNTNLSGWLTSGGSWEITENGYVGSGSGDCFAVAEQSVSGDFVFEGDVTLEAGQALGLIFRAADVGINAAGGYVLNFDMAQKNFRIFEFPRGGGGARDVVNKKFTDVGAAAKLGSKHHFELEAKGDTYTITFDGKVIAQDEVDTGAVREGRVGVMVFSGTARFDNVYLSTSSPIQSIVTEIAPVTVKTGSTEDNVLALLPQKVLAEQEDGVRINVDVTWDLSGVKLNEAGKYQAVGSIDGTDVKAYAIVFVNETGEAALESLTPAQLKVTAKAGSKPEDVFAKLQKDVVANYTDGSKINMVVSDWDYSEVNFDKAGIYDAAGYLSVDGERVEVTIPIKVTITKDGGGKPSIPGGSNSDWKWPSGSDSDSANGGKKNPQSGDANAIPFAMAFLAVSAGAVVLLRRKK